MINRKFAFIFLSSLTLAACAKTPSEPNASSQKQANQKVADPNLQSEIHELVERTKKNMVNVQGGSFIMGDFGTITKELEKTAPDSVAVTNPKGNVETPPYNSYVGYSSDKDNKPPHKVVLDSFKMTNNKITLRDYLIYLKATYQALPTYIEKYSKEIFHKLPAGTNWYNAQKYCHWLGNQMGQKMDLPTEAQWEYAARNRGQYLLYATNDGTMKNGVNIASYKQLEANKIKYHYKSFRHLPVLGEVPPNPLGIYDMVTNNKEWVRDWYSENYYAESPVNNPQGPKQGTEKVMRSSFTQGGDNAGGGDGMNIYRQKAPPTAILKERDETADVSQNMSFRCINYT